MESLRAADASPMAAALVAADARRFEHIAAQLRLVLGALGVLAIVLNWQSNSLQAMSYSSVAAAITLAWAITALLVTGGGAAPAWTKWVSALVDVTFVTAFSAGGLFNYSGAYETLLAPLFLGLYPLFLLLSALTGNAPLAVFAGFFAAVQCYALLRYIVDHQLVKVSENAVYGDEAVGLADQYTIVAFLAVFGFVFGALAWLLRREWSRNALETVQKQEAERRELQAERAQAHYRKYLSASVADFVMSNPDAMGLGGERRNASVVFVDIRNFTKFAEQERPERVVEFLNEVFTELVAVVFKHGGTLDKFLGDGLMAVFGVPQPLDDAPLRAVRAAIEMQACAKRINAARPAGADPFLIGVGIAHGVVIQGNIGSPDRMEFTVIGDTVNYAARLQGLSKDLAHDIIVSDEVYEGAKQSFWFRRMPPVKVRGKAGEQVLYAVIEAPPEPPLPPAPRSEPGSSPA
ncbi:hypothetical protein LBMAG42_48500 [Deltaproteobacteria bacterium]|nr:hypothetical protein LBMAG42_48500 [Deltaproteobacteria bacterium]